MPALVHTCYGHPRHENHGDTEATEGKTRYTHSDLRALRVSVVQFIMPRASAKRVATAEPAARLLDWYDRHARVLPWRARAPRRADPYHVWLSGVMLQQATVAAAGAYFQKFLPRWAPLR